ncbi:MAG TPA: type II toxin-antitoxin system RelE/ParE family toxin [Stellaceae bacterium]|nr:type II toxin-antitoxin system RelE/ParE family toxin [Stellaceae bacterium]
MARYRLAEPAKADISAILRQSEALHGRAARIRYRACLTAAMRRVAADPEGPSTVDRRELAPGIRSFHIRHSRDESREAPVAHPVHVIFYRVRDPPTVEIVRVLHDRMEPRRHVGVAPHA